MKSAARVLLILLVTSTTAAAVWWGLRHLPAHWWREDVLAECRGQIVTVADLQAGLRDYLWRRGGDWENLREEEQNQLREAVLRDLLLQRYLHLDRLAADGTGAATSEVNEELQDWRRQFQPDGERTLRMGRQQLTDADIEKRIETALTDQRWLDELVGSAAEKVDEDAAREWYELHAEELRVPPAIRASHIFLTRHDRDKPNREPEIRQIHRQLTAGEATFAELCAKFSEDERTKTRGGDLGWFTSDRMPNDFTTAVDKVAVGQTSEPLLTALGWHILHVQARQPSRVPTFEEARHEIEANLQSEARAASTERALQEMARRFGAGLWRARPEVVRAISPAPIH